MDATPPRRREPATANTPIAASAPAAEPPPTPADLVRRATALSALRGDASPAQARELGELLRHTDATLRAGGSPAAIAAAGRAATLLAPLQGQVSVPARLAAKFEERFAGLEQAVHGRRAAVEAALGGTSQAMGRAATSPTPLSGLRPPGAAGVAAAPITRAGTAPEPMPSRREARRAGETLDLSGRQQARAQRHLDAQVRRTEQQTQLTHARTEATQRRLSRGSRASAELDRAAAAELAELEAAERPRGGPGRAVEK